MFFLPLFKDITFQIYRIFLGAMQNIKENDDPNFWAKHGQLDAVKASEVANGQCWEVYRQPVDRLCPADSVLESFELDANAQKLETFM